MGFDPDTGQYIFDANTDIIAEFGVFFLHDLKDLAESPHANDSILRDWGIIRNWLRFSGDKFSQDDIKRIENAWMAYLYRGIAPSPAIQSSFSFYKREAQDNNIDYTENLPPGDVIGVFNRMLATEEEIATNASQTARIPNTSKGPAEKGNTKKLLRNLSWFTIISTVWIIWVANATSWDFYIRFAIAFLPPAIIGAIILLSYMGEEQE